MNSRSQDCPSDDGSRPLDQCNEEGPSGIDLLIEAAEILEKKHKSTAENNYLTKPCTHQELPSPSKTGINLLLQAAEPIESESLSASCLVQRSPVSGIDLLLQAAKMLETTNSSTTSRFQLPPSHSAQSDAASATSVDFNVKQVDVAISWLENHQADIERDAKTEYKYIRLRPVCQPAILDTIPFTNACSDNPSKPAITELVGRDEKHDHLKFTTDRNLPLTSESVSSHKSSPEKNTNAEPMANNALACTSRSSCTSTHVSSASSATSEENRSASRKFERPVQIVRPVMRRNKTTDSSATRARRMCRRPTRWGRRQTTPYLSLARRLPCQQNRSGEDSIIVRSNDSRISKPIAVVRPMPKSESVDT